MVMNKTWGFFDFALLFLSETRLALCFHNHVTLPTACKGVSEDYM